jgi:hypothetical protein
MSEVSTVVRILVIRAWTIAETPLRAALRRAGMAVEITRVDIEPAVNAALLRRSFDVIVLDPKTPTVTREDVEACLRAQRLWIPIVELRAVESLTDDIQSALANRLN